MVGPRNKGPALPGPGPAAEGIIQCPRGPPAFPGLHNGCGRAGLLSFPLKPASGLREPLVSWRPELALGRGVSGRSVCGDRHVCPEHTDVYMHMCGHACMFQRGPLDGPASAPRSVCAHVNVRDRVCAHTGMCVVTCVCVLPACVVERPGSGCIGCDPHFTREWPPGPLCRPVLPRRQPGILWPRPGAVPWIFGSAC